MIRTVIPLPLNLNRATGIGVRISSARRLGIVSAALLTPAFALIPQVARAQTSTFYQVTVTGLVDALTTTSVSSPASQYQIKNFSSGDQANGASYDPVANRLYYVRNLSGATTAQLWYLQFNNSGAVIGENLVRALPGTIPSVNGADYYNGRIWVTSTNTNVLYGYDTSNFAATPVTITLPPPVAHPSTGFVLGDLTFDDANNQLYIAGSLTGDAGANAFFYKYDLTNIAAPTLLASRDYTQSTVIPVFNGMAFNDATGLLYAYNSPNSSLYAIDTSTLMVSSTVGTNTELGKLGDLAGFTPFAGISDVTPEPSSAALLLGAAPLISGIVIVRRKRKK